MPRIKRKRGGQPGNRNARKHGFYAANLSPQEISELWNILNQGGIEPELAILRMKLGFILRYAPGNHRLLREITGLLYKWYRSRYGFNREDKSVFRKFICDFKNAVRDKENNLPEPIVSEP